MAAMRVMGGRTADDQPVIGASVARKRSVSMAVIGLNAASVVRPHFEQWQLIA